MKKNIATILFFLNCLTCVAQLTTYPPPREAILKHDFSIKVKAPGSQWQSVATYPARVINYVNFKGVVELTSFAYFDFKGKVEISITYNKEPIKSVKIRPAAIGIKPVIDGPTISFSLQEAKNLSIEINGNLYQNLQLFAGNLQRQIPALKDPNTIYFGPGIHNVGRVQVKSGQTVYIAGGAIVKGCLMVHNAKNVRITGRGIITQIDDLFKPDIKGKAIPNEAEMIHISNSENVVVDGITVVPRKYSVVMGESKKIKIENFKSFSSEGWGDGIDVFASSDIEMNNLFMRNSDDCIAIYATRKGFTGSSRNITTTNSTLWADIAHPILIGTHGNTPQPDEISNIKFKGIDILNESENQVDYQGCLAINSGDSNVINDISFEDVRIEDIRKGQIFNIRVMNNLKYNTSPGKSIENIYFKNITYTGSTPNLSVISGYDADRAVKNVTFENLKINGKIFYDSMPEKPVYYKTGDLAGFYIGEHATNIKFIKSE